MNSVIRADGSPLWAMISMLVGAIVNIILDPVFIFALDMGMTGAALATVIGQGVNFLMAASYFFRTKTFKLTPKSFIPKPRALWNVTSLGFSTFVTQLAIVVVTVLCNIQLARYGALSKYGADIPIAIIGIQSKVFTAIENFSKQYGYDLVIDIAANPTVLYYSEKVNFTESIIEALK